MPLKLFKTGPAADAEQTAADLVSLQLLPPGVMKVKFRDICKKYGYTFVLRMYADMVLRTGGGYIDLAVWDWASGFGSEQEKYEDILRAAEALPMNTTDGICDVVRTCCIKYLSAREERAERAEEKLWEAKEI